MSSDNLNSESDREEIEIIQHFSKLSERRKGGGKTSDKEKENYDDMSSNCSVADKYAELTNADIKQKILTGEFKILNKRGKSRVWNIFGKIQNVATGDEIQNIVSCRTCNNVYKYTQSTSNLSKHKCYISSSIEQQNNGEKIEVDSFTKIKGLQVFTEWSIENCRHFKIVKDTRFEEVIKYFISIGVKYGHTADIKSSLPHPTSISENVNRLYKIYFEVIKAEITEIKSIGFGLTSYLWTDSFLQKTYLVLTIHYIKEANIVYYLLGMKSMNAENCTIDNIKLKVQNILQDFDLDLDDNAMILTNRESNMIQAFQNLNHTSCIGQLLNDIIQKTIEETSEIFELVRNCMELVKYIKVSELNATSSAAELRWNTVYKLFVSIQTNWKDINKMLEDTNDLDISSNINLNYITAIIQILETFEQTFKALQAENRATIHLVYLHVHRLRKKCNADNSDMDVIKEFKVKLLHYLDNVVVNNLNIFHKIAIFLFPPLNKLIQFSEEEKQTIKDECKGLMKKYSLLITEHSIKEKTLKISSENVDLVGDFLPEIAHASDAIITEILHYESLQITFYDDFNILQWWEAHKKEFPLMYCVSCKILGTPASTVATQKVFSTARNLISEEECSNASNGDNINQIMFLHTNIPKDILQNEIYV